MHDEGIDDVVGDEDDDRDAVANDRLGARRSKLGPTMEAHGKHQTQKSHGA